MDTQCGQGSCLFESAVMTRKGSVPSVISLAIPNRNDQHVRSQGWGQERDDGWFFHSRGVSRGRVGAGAGRLLGGRPGLRNVEECQADLGAVGW